MSSDRQLMQVTLFWISMSFSSEMGIWVDAYFLIGLTGLTGLAG